MKVILLKDVARIGRRFEVKNVPDGHAFNYLIPNKLAELATPHNLKVLEERKAKGVAHIQNEHEAIHSFIENLTEGKISMTVEANEKGHLFKGIKADDIAALLNDGGLSIKADHVDLKAPIKEVGEHEITLRHSGDVHSFILVVNKR